MKYSSIRPELIGLGFLISSAIRLTIWVSYIFLKLIAVYGAAHGFAPGQMPYSHSHGIGAYLTIADFVLGLALGPFAVAGILWGFMGDGWEAEYMATQYFLDEAVPNRPAHSY